MLVSNRICVVGIHSDEIEELANITNDNKEMYTDKHGYDLCLYKIQDSDRMSNGKVSGFTKIGVLKNLIESNQYDWLFHVDADSLIMNHQIKVESLIDEYYDWIVSEDWNGINVGNFILKCSGNSVKFLEAVNKFAPSEELLSKTPSWWNQSEQCAMSELRHLVKTKIISQKDINSYILGPRPDNDWRDMHIGPSNLNWEPYLFQNGDFILHLVGDWYANKLINAHKYSKEVIT
jgi:hypothetical protein